MRSTFLAPAAEGSLGHWMEGDMADEVGEERDALLETSDQSAVNGGYTGVPGTLHSMPRGSVWMPRGSAATQTTPRGSAAAFTSAATQMSPRGSFVPMETAGTQMTPRGSISMEAAATQMSPRGTSVLMEGTQMTPPGSISMEAAATQMSPRGNVSVEAAATQMSPRSTFVSMETAGTQMTPRSSLSREAVATQMTPRGSLSREAVAVATQMTPRGRVSMEAAATQMTPRGSISTEGMGTQMTPGNSPMEGRRHSHSTVGSILGHRRLDRSPSPLGLRTSIFGGGSPPTPQGENNQNQNLGNDQHHPPQTWYTSRQQAHNGLQSHEGREEEREDGAANGRGNGAEGFPNRQRGGVEDYEGEGGAEVRGVTQLNSKLRAGSFGNGEAREGEGEVSTSRRGSGMREGGFRPRQDSAVTNSFYSVSEGGERGEGGVWEGEGRGGVRDGYARVGGFSVGEGNRAGNGSGGRSSFRSSVGRGGEVRGVFGGEESDTEVVVGGGEGVWEERRERGVWEERRERGLPVRERDGGGGGRSAEREENERLRRRVRELETQNEEVGRMVGVMRKEMEAVGILRPRANSGRFTASGNPQEIATSAPAVSATAGGPQPSSRSHHLPAEHGMGGTWANDRAGAKDLNAREEGEAGGRRREERHHGGGERRTAGRERGGDPRENGSERIKWAVEGDRQRVLDERESAGEGDTFTQESEIRRLRQYAAAMQRTMSLAGATDSVPSGLPAEREEIQLLRAYVEELSFENGRLRRQAAAVRTEGERVRMGGESAALEELRRREGHERSNGGEGDARDGGGGGGGRDAHVVLRGELDRLLHTHQRAQRPASMGGDVGGGPIDNTTSSREALRLRERLASMRDDFHQKDPATAVERRAHENAMPEIYNDTMSHETTAIGLPKTRGLFNSSEDRRDVRDHEPPSSSFHRASVGGEGGDLHPHHHQERDPGFHHGGYTALAWPGEDPESDVRWGRGAPSVVRWERERASDGRVTAAQPIVGERLLAAREEMSKIKGVGAVNGRDESRGPPLGSRSAKAKGGGKVVKKTSTVASTLRGLKGGAERVESAQRRLASLNAGKTPKLGL